MNEGAPALKVLLADDDGGILLRLKKLLSEIDGVRVVATAGDGIEAIAQLASCQIDVAVLDYQMPGHSGLDVLAHIRSRNLPIEVIILSAYDSEAFQRRCLAGGANLFVSKARTDLLRRHLSVLASVRGRTGDSND